MLLTKYTHSCIRLEQDSHILVIDPGIYSESAAALEGAHQVLITHEHPDHVDADALLEALHGNTSLEVFAPQPVATDLRGRASGSPAESRIIDVMPETTLDLPGFNVKTFGGQHALIHPLIPLVANIGYLINDDVYHPGDSFVIPHGVQPRTLLVPVHAPWSKTAEVIDFVIAGRAPRAYQIHDALLNQDGVNTVEKHVKRIGSYYGTGFEHLETGESVEL
ncbi:MBL fold metallo-hydrolase [Arthrobacter castelli]|uniref:MBL fold metallo-hydrolase n=1 Tax=Arthrobacter castelli TaxID=271431 RepID=UPI00040A79DB|nr:MBL fold metallo-hydrolase [Arthrobacter castelli]